MKKLLFLIPAAALAFVFACQTAQENKNANANANKNQEVAPPRMSALDKNVQIFIYDDAAKPGFYVIDDPGSIALHKSKNQKITWCVVYNGTTPPSDVVIDNFRMPPPPAPPTATNPFGDGSAADNTFDIPSANFNDCKNSTKTPKADALGSYKYTITVKVGNDTRGSLDPQVIIDN